MTRPRATVHMTGTELTLASVGIPNTGRYECPLCPRKFSELVAKKRHVKGHVKGHRK